jgi:hypothetical protein
MKTKTPPFRATRLTATQLADYIENKLSPKESKEPEDHWATQHCNLCASLIRKHLTLQWTKDLPTEPGYYWDRLPSLRGATLSRVYQNNHGTLMLEGHGELELYRGREWVGPILQPEECVP